jgi:hypothetical protein
MHDRVRRYLAVDTQHPHHQLADVRAGSTTTTPTPQKAWTALKTST